MSGSRTNIAQLYRTTTPNSPPANLSLRDGELAVEQSDPVRLWVGVPPSIDPTGRRLLVSRAAIAAVRAVPTGWVLDGANVTYPLVDANGLDINPSSAADCLVSVDGVVQQPTVDFTAAANVVTMTTAPRVDAAFWVVVQHRVV